MATLSFDEGSNVERFINSHNGADLSVNVATIYIVDKQKYKLWAYAYRGHLNEDNDGAPKAYGLDNPVNIFAPSGGAHVQRNLHPIDDLANAASPHQNFSHNNNFHWAGLFAMTKAAAQAAGVAVDTRKHLRAGNPDRDGVRDKFPVVQRSGQTAGYYVSTTAQAARPGRQRWEPERYWDASVVPYAVLSPGWATKRPVAPKLGDFGLAIRNDPPPRRSRPQVTSSCGFFFGDTGTGSKVGECSRKVVRTLAPDAFNEDFVTFLVFPGSGHGPPTPGQADRLIEVAIRAKMNEVNATTNRTYLPLFLGGLDASFHRYVEYVIQTERTDRPTDIVSRKRAEALRRRAEPGTSRMEVELQAWGNYKVPQGLGPWRLPGRLGPLPPP
jgi:hypothetical protein